MEERRHRLLKSSQHRTKPKNRLQREERENEEGERQTLTETDRESEMNSVPSSSSQQTAHSCSPTAPDADVEPTARNQASPAGQRPHSAQDPCSEKDAVMKRARQLLTMSKQKHFRPTRSASVKTAGIVPFKSTFSKRLCRGYVEQPARLLINNIYQKTTCSGQFTHKDDRRGQRIQQEEERSADLVLNQTVALQSSSERCRFNAVPPSSEVSTFPQILDKNKGGKPSKSPTVVKHLTFQEEQPSRDAMLHTSFEKIPPSEMSKDHPHSMLPQVPSKQVPPSILKQDQIKCDVFSEVVSVRRLHSKIKDRHAHFQSDITLRKYPPSPTNSPLGTHLPKIKARDGDPEASFDKPAFLQRRFKSKAAAKTFDGSFCEGKPFRSLLPAVISNQGGIMQTNDFYAKKNRNTNSKHLKAESTSKHGHRSRNKTTRNVISAENKHYSITNRPARVNRHAIDFNDNHGTFKKAAGKEYDGHGNLNNHAVDDEHPGEDRPATLNLPSTSDGVSQDGLNSSNTQTTGSEGTQGSTNVANSQTSAEKKKESVADSQHPSTSMSDTGSTLEKPNPSYNVRFTVPATHSSDHTFDREEEPPDMTIFEEDEDEADISKTLNFDSPTRKMSPTHRKKNRAKKASRTPDQRRSSKAVDPRKAGKQAVEPRRISRHFSTAARHRKMTKGQELKRANRALEEDVDTEVTPPVEIRITYSEQEQTDSSELERPKSPLVTRKRTVSRALGRTSSKQGRKMSRYHKAERRSRTNSRAAHLEPEAEEPVGHLLEVHLSDSMVMDLPEAPVIHLPETPTHSEASVEEGEKESEGTVSSSYSEEVISDSKTSLIDGPAQELAPITEGEQGGSVSRESDSGSVTTLPTASTEDQLPSSSSQKHSRWKTIQVGLLKGTKMSKRKHRISKVLPDILLKTDSHPKDTLNMSPRPSAKDLQPKQSSMPSTGRVGESHSSTSLHKMVSFSRSDTSLSCTISKTEMSHFIFSKRAGMFPTALNPSKELENKVRAWKKVMSSKVPKTVADRFTREGKQRHGQHKKSVGEKDIHSYQIYSLAQQLVRKKEHSQSQKKWYKAVRAILHANFIAKNMAQRSKRISMQYPTFMDIGDNAIQLDKETTKTFIDRTSYRSSRRDGFCMNPEEVDILWSDPAIRTEAEINLVMHKLQLIDSFCDFPLHTQRAIAKLGHYNRVHEKRVILREGHVPHNFYFILSGQAVVSMLMQGRKGMFRETQTTMTKGEMFGQRAIINRCERVATVTARSEMQLLYISLNDYIDIFMPERNLDGVPDYIKFLSRQSWMKEWPVELLHSNVHKCYLRYFRQRQVIVNDSTCSDNIYVVRSGLCQVLMLVDRVTTTWRDVDQLISEHLLTNDRFCGLYREERLRKLQIGQIKHSDRPLSPGAIRNASLEGAHLPSHLQHLALALAASRRGVRGRQSNLNLPTHSFSNVSNSMTDAADGSHLTVKEVIEQQQQQQQQQDLVSKTQTPPPPTKAILSVSSSNTTSSKHLGATPPVSSQKHSNVGFSSSIEDASFSTSDRNNNQGRDYEEPGESLMPLGEESGPLISGGSSGWWSSTSITGIPIIPSRQFSYMRKVRRRLRDWKPKWDVKKVTPTQSSWVRRRQYTIPKHCRPARGSVSAPLRLRKSPPVYVEILTLTEGDVFGFDQLDMPVCAQPRSNQVSLVSCGAEVIVMKKRFFMQHANVNVQQAVHLLTSPFPSPDEVKHVWRMEQARDLYHQLLKKQCNLTR